MTISLVTGANRGIGREVCRQLAAQGHDVLLGARSLEAAERAAKEVGATPVRLDVTSAADIERVAAGTGALDVLVNNAAITGGMPQEPTKVSAQQVLDVVDTNVVGVIRVTNAVLPMLRRAESPRIVNVSSTVGSLGLQTAQAEAVGPISAAYSPTKSYLNAITIHYAKELAGTGILVNAGCPGYVATDLNGHQGTRTPTQGAAVFLELATLPDGGPSGTFRDETGIQPW